MHTGWHLLKQPLTEVQAAEQVGWDSIRESSGPGEGALARLMETTFCCPFAPASCVWGGLNKGTMTPAERTAKGSPSNPCPEARQFSFPCMSLALFELLSLPWSLGWVLYLCMKPTGGTSHTSATPLSPRLSPCWFSQPAIIGLLSLALGLAARTPPPSMVTFTAKIFLPILNHHVWVWGQPI